VSIKSCQALPLGNWDSGAAHHFSLPNLDVLNLAHRNVPNGHRACCHTGLEITRSTSIFLGVHGEALLRGALTSAPMQSGSCPSHVTIK
jgi:hypothetical protein